MGTNHKKQWFVMVRGLSLFTKHQHSQTFWQKQTVLWFVWFGTSGSGRMAPMWVRFNKLTVSFQLTLLPTSSKFGEDGIWDVSQLPRSSYLEWLALWTITGMSQMQSSPNFEGVERTSNWKHTVSLASLTHAGGSLLLPEVLNCANHMSAWIAENSSVFHFTLGRHISLMCPQTNHEMAWFIVGPPPPSWFVSCPTLLLTCY